MFTSFSQLVFQKNTDSWMKLGKTEDTSKDTGINTALMNNNLYWYV